VTKKQQQIIGGGVVACLLLLAAGFFLLVKPKKSQIQTINAQTASEQSSNATLKSQIAMLQQQQAGLVGKQVVLREVAQRIPSDPEVPSLIRQLTQIETGTGVDVVSITPGAPTAPVAAAAPVAATSTAAGGSATLHPGSTAAATYQTIPITLSVQGNYSQMVTFFDKLENLQRLYLVKSLTLAPTKAGGGSSASAATGPDGKPQVGDVLAATVTGEVYETSADTTNIDLPALNGASTSGATAATAGTTAAAPSPTTSVN